MNFSSILDLGIIGIGIINRCILANTNTICLTGFPASPILKGTGASVLSILSIILLLVSVIIAIILIIVVARSITIGLKASIEMAEEISKGDLTVEFDKSLLDRKDEVGVLSSSLNTMMVRLKDIVTNIVPGLTGDSTTL